MPTPDFPLPTRRCHRRALTLLELLLVMALLVALTTLTWPALQQPLAKLRLRKAAERFGVACTQASAAAIDEGVICVIRCGIGRREYRTTRWDDTDQDTPANRPGGTESASTTHDSAEQLPEGIVFLAAAQEAEPISEPSPGPVASAESLPDRSQELSILFFPDGTSSDVTLRLTDQDGSTLEITIRGLTGQVRITEP